MLVVFAHLWIPEISQNTIPQQQFQAIFHEIFNIWHFLYKRDHLLLTMALWTLTVKTFNETTRHILWCLLHCESGFLLGHSFSVVINSQRGSPPAHNWQMALNHDRMVLLVTYHIDSGVHEILENKGTAECPDMSTLFHWNEFPRKRELKGVCKRRTGRVGERKETIRIGKHWSVNITWSRSFHQPL